MKLKISGQKLVAIVKIVFLLEVDLKTGKIIGLPSEEEIVNKLKDWRGGR